MSIKQAALIARGDVRDALAGVARDAGCVLQPGSTDAGIRFDHALIGAAGDAAIGFVDGWTVVWGSSTLFQPPLEYIGRAPDPRVYVTADFMRGALLRLSKGREVYFSISDGGSGTYGLDLYVDGERRRSYWESDGEVMRDEGASLDREEHFRERLASDEWGMIELLCHLTVPYETLESAPVDVRRITWDSTE